MALVITVPGTCSIVVVIWTASEEAVTFYGVLLQVSFLPGGGSLSVWFFRQVAGASASFPFWSLIEFWIFRF